MDYILTTNALKKQYRNFTALSGVSMHIPRGAIYGFVGRNGAGKTTLIRLICGLQSPTSGEYTLFGRSNTAKDINRSRQRMGAVVETPSIYLNMTAEDNLKEQYRVLGLPCFDTIPSLLRLVGLDNTGKKKAKNFSLGMRQRLGIAVALAGNPDFLVLDELSRLATHYGFIDKGCILREISAEDLEAACRKCLCITVDRMEVLCTVLDSKQIEYRVLSDNQAEIYGSVGITELVQALSAGGCSVSAISEREEGLENYYMNLIGGKENV